MLDIDIDIEIEKHGRVLLHNVVWVCVLCVIVRLHDISGDKDRQLIYLQFSV